MGSTLVIGQSADARATAIEFRPATEVLSQSRVRAIAQDLTDRRPKKLVESMQAYQLARQPNLVLVDPNNQQLFCGATGMCNYFVYRIGASPKQVWHAILRGVPRGMPQFQIAPTQSGPPCLVFNQLAESAKSRGLVQQGKLCWQNGEFSLVAKRTVQPN